MECGDTSVFPDSKGAKIKNKYVTDKDKISSPKILTLWVYGNFGGG